MIEVFEFYIGVRGQYLQTTKSEHFSCGSMISAQGTSPVLVSVGQIFIRKNH